MAAVDFSLEVLVEAKDAWDIDALDAIVDRVVERLKGNLPGELRGMVEDVETNPLDQLALNAIADRCEEGNLPNTAATFRRLTFKTGDVLLVRAHRPMTQERGEAIREAGQTIVDGLRRVGIEIQVVLLPSEFDLQLLRIQPQPEPPPPPRSRPLTARQRAEVQELVEKALRERVRPDDWKVMT